MAKVDPFIHPIPKALQTDRESRAFFEYLVRWCHDIWQRSGGATDTIENTEAAVVANDGGNRSTRYIKDEIANLWSHIAENKTKDPRAEIQRLDERIDTLKTRSNRDEIDMLYNLIADLKRQNRTLTQLVNELTERIDSGT